MLQGTSIWRGCPSGLELRAGGLLMHPFRPSFLPPVNGVPFEGARRARGFSYDVQIVSCFLRKAVFWHQMVPLRNSRCETLYCLGNPRHVGGVLSPVHDEMYRHTLFVSTGTFTRVPCIPPDPVQWSVDQFPILHRLNKSLNCFAQGDNSRTRTTCRVSVQKMNVTPQGPLAARCQ